MNRCAGLVVAGEMNFRFSPHFRTFVTLCSVGGASTEKLESSTALHRPFQYLHPVGLAFDRVGGPGWLERGLGRTDVATQACSEIPQRRSGGRVENLGQALGCQSAWNINPLLECALGGALQLRVKRHGHARPRRRPRFRGTTRSILMV